MRLSLSTGCIYLYPLKVAFAWAKELGCDGVEVAVSPEILVRGVGLVRELSAQFHLPIFALHPPLFAFPGWGAPLERFPTLLGMAQEVGAPLIVLHAVRFTEPGEPRALQLRRILEAHGGGRGGGPEVALETPALFFARDGGYFLHHPERLARFVKDLETRVVLDTAHGGTNPLGLMPTYQLFRNRLAEVHFSNLTQLPASLDWPYLHSYFKHHQLPGEGVLPLADFLRTLKADGFGGPLTLEFSPVALGFWCPPLAKRRLAGALDFVRESLAES